LNLSYVQHSPLRHRDPDGRDLPKTMIASPIVGEIRVFGAGLIFTGVCGAITGIGYGWHPVGFCASV
jgi:hypothetical protein